MEKIRFPKGYKVYLPLVLLFALLVFMMPRSPKFNYDYKKGSPWMYEDLVSLFDFPLLKSEDQYKADLQKAGSAVVPVYRQDPTVADMAIDELASADFGDYGALKPAVGAALEMIYSKGVLPKNASQKTADGLIYIQKDMRAGKVPAAEVYTVDGAAALLRDVLSDVIPASDLDSVYNYMLASLVVSDLTYDQQMTDLISEENVGLVSPTSGVVKAGQTLVSQGELVTEEVQLLLDSYKVEYETSVGYNGPVALQWMGNILISLFLVIILFFAIYFCNYKIFKQFNKYLYLLLVFTISAVSSLAVAQADPHYFYMLPFTLIALYLLAFFSRRLVFIVYFISLLPMLITAPDGMELFFIYLAGGVVAIYVFDFFNRGWLQFVCAFITFAVMALVWLGFRLVDGVVGVDDLSPLWHLALAAFFAVAGYPLIFLFEKMFMLVSSSKLVELSDTSRPLLRLLADKAPGTFQHSLQVMNLADAAARAIDANIPLIRAAALYHDIGKISNPQCFTENQIHGSEYHESLTPRESAQDIIRHVSDGLVLADKYSLPSVLKEFIVSHHGTTCAAYFLNKHLNAGGDPTDVADFYYNGVKPVSKEQVILMLCDAVEAASRSQKNYSEESISELVNRIVDGKADDGQLSESAISLKEVNDVKAVMKKYLQQMYHSRISYPKRVGATKK